MRQNYSKTLNRLNLKPRTAGYLAVFVSALLVGSISTISKPILANINPIFLASFVYLLAALAATPLVKKSSLKSISKKDWLLILAISGFGSIIAPAIFFMGLEKTTASNTTILSNAETIFTVLFALIFFKEKLKPMGYLAVGLVFAGLIIVTTNLEFSNFLSDFKKEGDSLILLAAICWALDNNLSRIVAHRVDISRLVQLKSSIGGGTLLFLALLLGIHINVVPLQIPNILILGIFGFGFSLFFFLHSLKRIGTVRTMLIFSTSSIFGLIFAVIFLHETIGVYQILAIVTMLLGIYLIAREGHEATKL